MRPPWIEATALLAAHGFAAPDPSPSRPTRRPAPDIRMPDAAQFDLVPKIDGITKPFVFDSLPSLARAIERRRDGRPVQLEDVEDLEFAGSAALHHGVKITALDMGGDPDALIGFAWLNERGRDVLEPALRDARRAMAAPRKSAA